LHGENYEAFTRAVKHADAEAGLKIDSFEGAELSLDRVVVGKREASRPGAGHIPTKKTHDLRADKQNAIALQIHSPVLILRLISSTLWVLKIRTWTIKQSEYQQ